MKKTKTLDLGLDIAELLGSDDAQDLGDLIAKETEKKTQKAPGQDLIFGSIQPIQKVTAKHHNAARLVAEGLKDTQIAAILGYTPQRICQLRNDPLFKELVAWYENEVQSKYLEAHETRHRVGKLALMRLEERLGDDEAAATVGMKTLVEVAQFALDGQKSSQQNVGIPTGGVSVNISFGQEAGPKGPTIELQAEGVKS